VVFRLASGILDLTIEVFLSNLHQEQDWETLWPLLIPPVLTYMDDWAALHRLQGVNICHRLIERSPSSILSRTGIDELMRSVSVSLSNLSCTYALQSLETSLLRYSDSISPILFERAMMASLELVEKTTKEGTPERYQRLFALLGESIIGGAWMYGYREMLLIQATYEVLPLLLDAIGIACVRYLKALILQLLHTLIPTSEIEVSASIQEASLRALRKVIQIAAPRMAYWSGEIVSGISRCWVSHNVQDSGRYYCAIQINTELFDRRDQNTACGCVTRS
jgi:Tti2 family